MLGAGPTALSSSLPNTQFSGGKLEYDVDYGQQEIKKKLPVMNLRSMQPILILY